MRVISRRFVIGGLIGAAMSAGALAQETAQAPSTKGMVAKGKAPVNQSVLQVTLPKPEEADLPNGLHLIVLEDHRAPVVTFQLLVRGAGGYYDSADLPGAANFTAALMREGTQSRTSQQLSEQLERMAATLNVVAGISRNCSTSPPTCC
jgi:zinc protease